MASKDPSNIDKHIDYKLKLRLFDSGMSQEALGVKVGLSFQQIQKYEKGANRISASRLFELTRILEFTSIISLKGIKHPALISEWRTAPPFQNLVILSAAMKV